MPRKHILFPTRDEVREDPSIAYSDHLPILAKVPLPQNQGSLNIVSLNILGAGSGIHPAEFQEDLEEHTKPRYERIAKGLKNAINLNNVGVLLLQEASEDIVPFLKKELGETWEIVVDEIGLISCYNKESLECTATSLHKKSRIRTLSLRDRHSNSTIEVHNVWGEFSPFPDHHEKQFNDLFTTAQCSSAVIIGDTNSRIAPLDNNKRNITTGIIPPIFNKMNNLDVELQVPDHPDGAFYYDGTAVHQLATEILDFQTGKPVNDTRSEEEADAWTELRMIMCLDEQYKTQKFIVDKTIFEYETQLKKELNDNILVRIASDCYNNKALAIRFPPKSPEYVLVKELLKSEQGLQFREVQPNRREDGNKPFPCVFVPLNKIPLLEKAIKTGIAFKGLGPKEKDQVNVLCALSVFIEGQCERLEAHKSKKGVADKLQLFKNLQVEIKKDLGTLNINKVSNYVMQTATIAHHRRHRTSDKARGLFTLGLFKKNAASWDAYKTFIDKNKNIFQSNEAKELLEKSKRIRADKISCKVNVDSGEEEVQGYEAYRSALLKK